MSLLDKARAAGEQALAKAKEGVDDVQARRELASLYNELGQETFRLIEAGGLDRPELETISSKIRLRLADQADGAPEDGPSHAEGEHPHLTYPHTAEEANPDTADAP